MNTIYVFARRENSDPLLKTANDEGSMPLTVSHFSIFQSLKLSSKARKDKTVGEIVNLVTVDVQKVSNLTFMKQYASQICKLKVTL